MNVMNSKSCQEVNMHEEINTHEDDQDCPTLVDDSDSDVDIKYNIRLNKETPEKLPRTQQKHINVANNVDSKSEPDAQGNYNDYCTGELNAIR